MPVIDAIYPRIDSNDPKDVVRNFAGSLSIGSFITIVFYGVILQQSATYWKYSNRDPPYTRCLVLLAVLMCTIYTVSCMITSYLYTINDFGDASAILNIVPSHIITESLLAPIAAMARAFFAFRVLKLTGKRWVPLIVWILGIGEISCGIVSAVSTIEAKLFTDISLMPSYAAAVAAFMVLFADILVASYLLRYLWCSRTGSEDTDSLLTKISRFTVQTGAMTVVAELVTIMFATLVHQNNKFIGIYPAGMVHPFCMMSALNSRHEWGTQSLSSAPSGGASSAGISQTRFQKSVDSESGSNDSDSHPVKSFPSDVVGHKV